MIQRAINENEEEQDYCFIGECSFSVEAISTAGQNRYEGFDADTKENETALRKIRSLIIEVKPVRMVDVNVTVVSQWFHSFLP